MSQFLRHEPCPRCRSHGLDRSGNNLGVWSDHKYCFSCSYVEGSSKSLNLKDIQNRLKRDNKNKNDYRVALPSDYDHYLPDRCLEWLEKYGLTNDEIRANKIGWSEQHERLIFPVWDGAGNLVFFQGRKFSSDGGRHSKYFTGGRSEDVFHILGPDDSSIILVEDAVSAIKVARVAQVMPLWGSNIGPERVRRLAMLFKRLVIWLDKDKAEYSLKTRLKASPYFDKVKSVVTNKDPKCYETEEIKEILNG